MEKLSYSWRGQLLKRRYCLHDLIAQGEYSRIFLASDLASDYQKCVVKKLVPKLYPIHVKQTIESMFQREAEILQKLNNRHPQICQFYDYFTDDGSLYLVQEWIKGLTLEKQLLTVSKLSESKTREILLNILPVLDFIHSLGIIHRDLTPNNIILRSRNQLPVLIDFGIATEIDNNNQQNFLVGTPGYISPEQTMGQISGSNDLYSLALTTIHLLTGISPKELDLETSDNFWEHSKFAFGHDLVAVIDRAISPDPAQRFTTAMQMRQALQPDEKPLTLTPSEKQLSTPKGNPFRDRLRRFWLYSLIISVEIAVIWFALRYLVFVPDYQPQTDIVDTPSAESPIAVPNENITESDAVKNLNNKLQAVIFNPGTSENQIQQTLGEPLWRRPGFWANSIAWSYEDIVAEDFDLGYMFDSRTNRLRQSEIAVPPTTDFSTVRLALQSLLGEPITVDIESGLQAVYQRQKKTHNFTLGNFEGIIQRNAKDRIYLAVWEADFH
jgi:serine/threonine-protein kinase